VKIRDSGREGLKLAAASFITRGSCKNDPENRAYNPVKSLNIDWLTQAKHASDRESGFLEVILGPLIKGVLG
jgi:hypothetical protein